MRQGVLQIEVDASPVSMGSRQADDGLGALVEKKRRLNFHLAASFLASVS